MHTKEPWSYGEDNDGWYLQHGVQQLGYALSESDARRIVACVNACADIPTELLESKSQTPRDAFRRLTEQRDEALHKLAGAEAAGEMLINACKALELQRDVLLDALKSIRSSSQAACSFQDLQRFANAAIEKAEAA